MTEQGMSELVTEEKRKSFERAFWSFEFENFGGCIIYGFFGAEFKLFSGAKGKVRVEGDEAIKKSEVGGRVIYFFWHRDNPRK